MGLVLSFVLILAVFWLLILRPQQRRQRELRAVQSSLSAGSDVMLSSGIYGTVVSVADESVRVEIAPGTTIKVARQAVVRVVEDSVTPTDQPTDQPTDEPGSGTDDGPAPAGSADSSDEH